MFSSSLVLALAFFKATLAYHNTEGTIFMHKTIDPIVSPGGYKTHMHSFVGSDAVTSKTTTSAELRKGCTSAEHPDDFSSYWVPTLYFTGNGRDEPVPASAFAIYYVGIDRAEAAIPENFKVIAGNMKATTQAETFPDAKIDWFCEGDPAENKDPAAFPTKRCSTHLQHLVWFPNCVNMQNVTQVGYAADSSASKCPAGQTRIPQMRFSIRYDARGFKYTDGPAPFRLSSGNSYSAHGDWINGWTPEAAKNMVQLRDRNHWQPLPGVKTQSACKPIDRDPNNTAGSMRAKRSEGSLREKA